MAADRQIPEGDTPLSVADGAPDVIEIAGAKARIPAQMDLRIASVIDDACELSETDWSLVILYCALHTTKKSILQLWTKARKNPKSLYEEILYWEAKIPAAKMSGAMEDIQSYLIELSDEQELDAEDSGDNSKKKT